jgi:thioesterase domain-containing protein
VPGITQAAVIAREDTAGDRRLVAYVVPSTDTQGAPASIDLPAVRQRLSAALPDYMVPAAFVVLEALPLTPNGKLDRPGLPAPEGTGLAADYVAPTTPEEVLLCDLVAELLGLPRVGLADNFFRLGGHSLMAARLAARVLTRLGHELPIRTIFEYPILRDLASQIGIVTDRTTVFDVLLPIRTTGSLPPLFCLHPVGGLCWSYTNLLRHTDEEQPIYGIQARGFSDDRRLPETFDELIAESLAQIRHVRAHGPYRLLGWSFGGILAHVLATRLQAEGERVDRLVLFDSYPPVKRPPDPARREPEPRGIWHDLAMATDLTIPSEPADLVLDADTIHALARAQSHILGSLPLHQLEQVAAVMANNSRFMPTLKIEPFDGDILLYVVTRRHPDFDSKSMNPTAWVPYCHGTIRTIAIDATHNKMLMPEALKQIGRLPF